MRKALWVAIAMLVAPGRGYAATRAQSVPMPTPQEAQALISQAELDLDSASEYLNRAAWVQSTYITDDTDWLYARAFSHFTNMAVRYVTEANRFDHVVVDAGTRRKLDLLKQLLVVPAPSNAAATQEMADIATRLAADYSTATFEYRGKVLTLGDSEALLRTTRDPETARAIWQGWRASLAPRMKSDYANMVKLANAGARELGYADTGELWRSWYDMPPDSFALKLDSLWAQVAPLYGKLHCYVRTRLNERYGESVQPSVGPIRADLLGDMWGQAWGNVYDIVAAEDQRLGYDLGTALQTAHYDAVRLTHTADNWYQSIGLPPLPATFWERSQLTRPRDRDVECHGFAMDVDNKDDVRMRACLTASADDFYTVHHELGHAQYYRAYSGQPYLFRAPGNDGFDEAIGDFAGLNAVTPDYLRELGLIQAEPGPEADIPYLLRVALDKLPLLAFARVIDEWRWQVFSGRISAAQYNDAWWALTAKYQQLMPPGPRPHEAFDPVAKFHVANNIPYARYFLAVIYEFQFYRGACKLAGWTGTLNRCNVFGNKLVGARLQRMLAIGKSRPWPEAMATFTGEHDLDASGLLEYFAPLEAWLDRQESGRQCLR